MKYFLILIFITFGFKNAIAQIDSTFGTNGHLNIDVNGVDNYPTLMRHTIDNCFITSGYDMNLGMAFLKKIKTNGTIDSSFASGQFEYYFPINNPGSFYDIIQNADSSYLVFGNYGNSFSIYRNLIIKINKNGIIDSNYNLDGAIIYNPPLNKAIGRVCMIDTDKKILISGVYTTGFSENKLFIVRFNSNGLIDNSFGINGLITNVLIDSTSFIPMKIFRDDSMHYMVIGWKNNIHTKVLYIRFNNDGSYDSSYDVNGVKQLVGFDNFAMSGIRVKEKQCYLYGGFINPVNQKIKSSIIKTNLFAQPDFQFGTNGIDSNIIISNFENNISGLEFNNENDFLISGTVFSNNTQFYLTKKDINGNLVNSFGNNGLVVTNTDSTMNDFAGASCLLTDYSWIVGGDFYSLKINHGQDMTFCKVAPIYPLSILELKLSQNILIYPNPSNGVFNIESNVMGIDNIKVYNSQGDMVYSSAKNVKQIDLSNQSKGMYLIVLQFCGKAITKQVIVK